MLRVYFDQNVFGHILDSGSDWRAHPLVRCMLEKYPKRAALWISPTHIIELVQCSDTQRRQKLAGLMLELCGARRMWSGSDFFLVEQFGEFLNSYVPGAFDRAPFFSEYKLIAERLWLGYLGLLAASPVLPLGPAVEKARLAKAQTALIHARIAADPNENISRIIKCAQTFETTRNKDPLGLENLTLAQIETELASLRMRKNRPTAMQLERLKKERAQIAAVYGSIDIGAALEGVFRLPCDLELTFNTPAIVAKWSDIKKATNCVSLPKEVALASPEELRATRAHLIAVLQCCIHAAACAGLSAASVGYYAVLRELEVKLNQERLPKGSVTLDVDHATACLAFDVFVCHDQALYENMRTLKNRLDNAGASVISDAAELEALCRGQAEPTLSGSPFAKS